MPKNVPNPMKMQGFGWRVSVSILVVFGWAIFLALWFIFYAGNFSFVQNLGVFFLSIIVGVAILAAAWAPWGIKYGKKFGKDLKSDKSTACCKTNVSGGCGGAIYGLGFIGALIYYITTAPTFLDAVIGFFKAIVWPAFLVFGALKSLGL